MNRKKQPSIGLRIVTPGGIVVKIRLKNSFITPEKDVESPELLRMKDEFVKDISECDGDIGFAFAKEFAENGEDGRVGHWVYLGGNIGFVFHYAMDRNSVWEGIKIMIEAIQMFTDETTEVKVPDIRSIISDKVGNA